MAAQLDDLAAIEAGVRDSIDQDQPPFAVFGSKGRDLGALLTQADRHVPEKLRQHEATGIVIRVSAEYEEAIMGAARAI